MLAESKLHGVAQLCSQSVAPRRRVHMLQVVHVHANVVVSHSQFTHSSLTVHSTVHSQFTLVKTKVLRESTKRHDVRH